MNIQKTAFQIIERLQRKTTKKAVFLACSSSGFRLEDSRKIKEHTMHDPDFVGIYDKEVSFTALQIDLRHAL